MKWTESDIYQLRIDHQYMLQGCTSLIELNEAKIEIQDTLASIRSNLSEEQAKAFMETYEKANEDMLDGLQRANELGVPLLPEKPEINWYALFIVVAFFGYMAFS